MKTLVDYTSHEEEIKKSRFIVHAQRVENPEEALAFLDEVMDPSARHNCWAYKIGLNYRFNDDGEPTGTAGKRILGAIEQQDMDHVMVVVVRWFGGIKLGVGGLSRAYGGSASTCLREAEFVEVKAMSNCRIRVPFKLSSNVYHLMDKYQAQKISEEYEHSGAVMIVSLESDSVEKFADDLIEMSNGVIELKVLKDE